MRSLRIASDILDVLADNKRHTIAEISERIEVSYNTVQRHVADLSARYPITVTTGGRDSAGVQLSVSYQNLNTIFSKQDLELIIKSLNLLRNEDNVNKVIKKLESYL